MKKGLWFALSLIFVIGLVACNQNQEPDYQGTYIGYSWKGEAQGTTFEEATEYVKTELTLSKDGTIEDVEMDFMIKKGDIWISRLDTTATVTVDFNVTPIAATPGTNYVKGTSMFNITTNDMMSFYAVAVDIDGTVALLMVDPITRYQFEFKLPSSFDFSQPISSLSVGSGLMVPTVRVAGGGLLRPESWDTLSEKHFLNISGFSHVVKDNGVLEGISASSTVQVMLEELGVTFISGVPQTKIVSYGFFGMGGWSGNYEAIETYLIGKNALEVLSLVDWTNERYAPAINDQNQFGIDVPSGATRTAQDSYDTIAGATVRMSRESESYQKALVEAGIITLDQVIIGRF